MLLTRTLVTVVAVCVSLATLACPWQEERVRSLGPEVRADFVIFFNHGVTHDQIENFWSGTLSKPDTGRGHDLATVLAKLPESFQFRGMKASQFPFSKTQARIKKTLLKRM